MLTRGKHRIYLGMAPGVGKTYRMLEEANDLREEGIDVVIGIIETHGREETRLAIAEQRFSSIRERILVCVSTYPNSSQLLRRGARLASQLHGDLYAVYVAHPDRFLSKDDVLYLEMCQQFCRDFDGEFIRVENSNIAEAIANIAHKYAITLVVLGHSQKSHWQSFFKNSPIQSLLKHLQNVDLHIIAIEK